MKWKELSSKAKWALAVMLVAIIPSVAGVVIGSVVFGEAAPPFVYAFPVIWLILFFVGLIKLKVGLMWYYLGCDKPLCSSHCHDAGDKKCSSRVFGYSCLSIFHFRSGNKCGGSFLVPQSI